MTPDRTDLLIGAAGAAVGVFLSFQWGSAGYIPEAIVLGASLGASRRYPRATWLVASVTMLLVAARGAYPGDEVFVGYTLIAAHAFSAGRWDPHWRGLGGAAALYVAGQLTEILAHDAGITFLFIVPAAWGAGRVLRKRMELARQLEERARELDEEREAYAALSVRYERARVASELHDIVAHAISVMVVQASAGQRLAAHDPEATAETFDAIASAARDAERDMGRLVTLLGDEHAIGPAPDLALVEELVARAAGSGLDVTLRLEGDREGMPAPLGEVAYRVVQEGLTNALRYAAGAAVTVLVRGDRQELVVAVENGPADGDAALAGIGTGNGLLGLRARVGEHGGTLDVGPTAQGGWRLGARLPRRVTADA